jgi:hypothetical protein
MIRKTTLSCGGMGGKNIPPRQRRPAKAAWRVTADVVLRGWLPSRNIAARLVGNVLLPGIRSLAQLAAGNSWLHWALRDRSAACGMPFPPGHRRGRHLDQV